MLILKFQLAEAPPSYPFHLGVPGGQSSMVLFAFDHAVDLHAVRCGRNAPGKEKAPTLTVKGPFPRSRLQMRFPRGRHFNNNAQAGAKFQAIHGSEKRRDVIANHQPAVGIPGRLRPPLVVRLPLQSSSASRRTAGAPGFLILIQWADRPARYGDPSRLYDALAAERIGVLEDYDTRRLAMVHSSSRPTRSKTTSAKSHGRSRAWYRSID